MTMDTSRADMTQAVLEGVAFALRDSLEVAKSLGIDLKRTKICGGGAKSPLWKATASEIPSDISVPGLLFSIAACGNLFRSLLFNALCTGRNVCKGSCFSEVWQGDNQCGFYRIDSGDEENASSRRRHI